MSNQFRTDYLPAPSYEYLKPSLEEVRRLEAEVEKFSRERARNVGATDVAVAAGRRRGRSAAASVPLPSPPPSAVVISENTSQLTPSSDPPPSSLLIPTSFSSEGRKGGGVGVDMDEDNVSGITKDDESAVSKVRAVVVQSMQLLRGQAINEEAVEEHALPTIKSEDRESGADATDNYFESGDANRFSALTEADADVVVEEDFSTGATHRSVWFSTQLTSVFNNSYSDRGGRVDDGGVVVSFLDDPPGEMTYARRIALFLMQRYKWYNPQLGANEKEVEECQSEKKSTSDSGEGSETEGGGGDTGRHIREHYAVREGMQEATDAEGREWQDNSVREISWKKVQRLPPPSLEKAWVFFEHNTLSRYVLASNAEPDEGTTEQKKCCRNAHCDVLFSNDKVYRAEPGENEYTTRLYSPLLTPLSQMGDFGIGIGLYFSILRALCLLTFLAGLVSTYNIVYFSGAGYSDGQQGISAALLRGSAICTRQVWVPCPSCSKNDWRQDKTRWAMGSTSTGENMAFAKRNDCELTLEIGMVNYGTMLFIIIGVIVLNCHVSQKCVEYDEDEQTAQDYSILIRNPPPDELNPDEWKKYFAEAFGAHTTVVTLAIDNDLLLRQLVKRREILEQLARTCPGESLDVRNLAHLTANVISKRFWFHRFLAHISPGVPELFSNLVALNGRIQGLAQLDYPVTNVFITFETEAMQRDVLTAFSAANSSIRWGKTQNSVDLFRGRVLRADEAAEPCTVRWQDLNTKLKYKVIQLTATTVCTIAALIVIIFVVYLLYSHANGGEWYATVSISIFNAIFPIFAKLLTNFEQHGSENKKQTSLYAKIAIFRWTNTAVVTTIIIPFTATLTAGRGNLIESISAIFIAEIATSNGMQLLDVMGHINRHILAPRAPSQAAMNKLMTGNRVELAERYTNMSKILFLTFWYSSIFPAAFFFCAFAMLTNFMVDKFSLMRTWARPPLLGPGIAVFSRRYVMTSSLVILAFMSSLYWSAFPFDNLCASTVSGECNEAFCDKQWKIDAEDASNVDLSMPYRYCDQSLLLHGKFPFVPMNQPEGDEWMTADQENVSRIYGWSSLAIISCVALYFGWRLIRIFSRQSGDEKLRGDGQGINFSDVPFICSYIPQVLSPNSVYPFIVVDTSDIDDELYHWEDPDNEYGQYDLTRDAQELLGRDKDISSIMRSSFSRIGHYPPDRER